MIYLELIWAFIQIGLFSVGGGYAAIPLIQAQAVDARNWISMAEFTDLITIAEMTPGPIAINSATFVGTRVAGFGGALAATFGCIFPSCIIVSLLAYVYFRWKNISLMKDTLSALRPVVVALIASAGLSILIPVVHSGGNWDILGGILFAAAFVLLRMKKVKPIAAMFACGAVYLIAGII